MARLLFGTLFSGSSGNAVYVSFGNDALLIDAGKNNKSIEEALSQLGESPDKIRAVFITHEHTDHISALPVFTKKHPVPVHLALPCAECMKTLPRTSVLHVDPMIETVGPFTVESFYTPHDSARPVGYTVRVAGKKLGVATDMGMLAKNVVEALTGCDAALIECNYDLPMLLDNRVYSPQLKARIKGQRGHLSNDDGALLAAVLAYTGTQKLLLGHLSAENNTPEKAYETVKAELERRNVSSKIAVAARDCPTILIDEEI